jgi:hypothetical protein
MTGMMKAMCRAGAVALLLAVVTAAPARAQFGGGDEDTMAKFAPMLEMMKAKMGKKRFAMLMQTAGPMMSNMMEGGGGGLGGMLGGGDLGGGFGGGGDFMSMLGNSGMVAMLPQMMSMIDTGGGSRKVKRKRARR